MVTFCEDLGHRCNIDDSGWTLYTTREAAEPININRLNYPGVLKIEEGEREQTDVEQQLLRTPGAESQCRLQVIKSHDS